MTPQTFIFLGRSGCGKGTQLKLLREALSETDPSREHFAFSTGDAFREFFASGSDASQRAHTRTHEGKLLPLFLAVSMWGGAFARDLKPEQHAFIDGYPRTRTEAEILVEALRFFERTDVVLLDFVVSADTSRERMLSRGRDDDTPENITERLAWYENDVMPAIEHLKSQETFRYVALDGEKTIEEIHGDVMSAIG